MLDMFGGVGMQDKLFIGGEFVDGVEQATFEVLNPHDPVSYTPSPSPRD
jgi:hypothetical protein